MKERDPMLEVVVEHRALVQYSVIVFLTLACWIWGDGPERICGSVLCAMPFAEVAYHLVFGPQATLSHTDVGHAIMQVVVAVPFLAVALTANRIYPIWLVSFQLIAVLSHLVRNLVPDASGTAYMIMTIGPSYGMIITLSLGLLAHRRRVRDHGKYRSWRTSSAPWRANARDHSPAN